MNSNIKQLQKEYQTLKKRLDEFYNECQRKIILKTNEYNYFHYFDIYNDILYVSVSYLLSNFKYQTKLFYTYFIEDDFKEFNIKVIAFDDTEFTIEDFMNYKISNNWFNKDLFFQVLNELYQNECCLIGNKQLDNKYLLFYVSYLLTHKDLYDTNNEKMNLAIIQFLRNFEIYTVDSLDTNLTKCKSFYNYNKELYSNYIDEDFNDSQLQSLYGNSKSYESIEDYDDDINKTTILCLTDNSITYLTTHCRFCENLMMNTNYDHLMIINNRLKKICINNFFKLDFSVFSNSEWIKNNLKKIINSTTFNPDVECIVDFKIRTQSILEIASLFYETKDILCSSMDNYTKLLKDYIELSNLNSKLKSQIMNNANFFVKEFNTKILKCLCLLSKKFILEMPKILELFEIDYSPLLCQLFL